MFHRHYDQGPQLNVENLNFITVIIDRSETSLTEVALNTWTPSLNGPPHSHEGKEQVFFVTSGHGSVTVGQERFQVAVGDLVYVPAGVVHQTISEGGDPLAYLLFNAFLDTSKEGDASFADHVEKFKKIRKRQAESGVAAVDGEAPAKASSKVGKRVHTTKTLAETEPLSQQLVLLDRQETDRSSVIIHRWTNAAQGPTTQANEEVTFFVLSGQARISASGESCVAGIGDVVFIPSNVPYLVQATQGEFRCLCLSTSLEELPTQ